MFGSTLLRLPAVTASPRTVPPLMLPSCAGTEFDHHRDVSRQHVLGRRIHAAIGHVLDLGVGAEAKQLRHQMDRGRGAGGAVAVLAGILAQQVDEAFKISDRQVLVDHQHQRQGADQRHRRKAADRIVAQVVRHGRKHRGRGRRLEDDGVAVGLGVRERVGRDGAAAAGLVLDHELVAEPLAQLHRCDARQEVDAAARRERHQHADRPRRIGRGGFLAERRKRRRERGQHEAGGQAIANGACCFHGVLPLHPSSCFIGRLP